MVCVCMCLSVFHRVTCTNGQLGHVLMYTKVLCMRVRERVSQCRRAPAHSLCAGASLRKNSRKHALHCSCTAIGIYSAPSACRHRPCHARASCQPCSVYLQQLETTYRAQRSNSKARPMRICCLHAHDAGSWLVRRSRASERRRRSRACTSCGARRRRCRHVPFENASSLHA